MRRLRETSLPHPFNAESSLDSGFEDPGLLKKYSTFKSYKTSIATYPKIRTFYRPHPQATKLPDKPRPLPLLVFVHGLGGSLAQFHPLLTSLVNVGPCLGIDLPGCGQSEFAPTTWEAYSVSALAEVLLVAIEQYVDQEKCQGVIMIGHSMGCSLSAMLASSNSTFHRSLKFEIVGFVAICPKASIPSAETLASLRRLLSIPTPLFDLWRLWDRRGGPNSASVRRFVGAKADLATKTLQEKFNKQSKTAVWRRMTFGLLPSEQGNGDTKRGLPGPELWSGVSCPLFLIAGEGDKITPPEELSIISESLGYLNDQQQLWGSRQPSLSPKGTSDGPSSPLGKSHVTSLALNCGKSCGLYHDVWYLARTSLRVWTYCNGHYLKSLYGYSPVYQRHTLS